MQTFSQDGRKFIIAPTQAGWSWAVTTMTGEIEESGACPTRATAAACIVRATVRRIAPLAAEQRRLSQAA